MTLSNRKAIELAISSLKKQMKNKPSGGYKVGDDKVKFTEIIKTLEELQVSLSLSINHKCKDCGNYAGKLDGTGMCFPQTNYTSSRNYNDGCTHLFIPKKGKNILDKAVK